MGATYGPRMRFDFPSGTEYGQAIVQAAEIDTYPGVCSFHGGKKAEIRHEVALALENALSASLDIDYPEGVVVDEVRRESGRVKVRLSSMDRPNND